LGLGEVDFDPAGLELVGIYVVIEIYILLGGGTLHPFEITSQLPLTIRINETSPKARVFRPSRRPVRIKIRLPQAAWARLGPPLLTLAISVLALTAGSSVAF
jgi:hypothetical protein